MLQSKELGLEKTPAQEQISSIVLKEMEEIRMYGEEVTSKLSEFERKLIGQCPLSQIKDTEAPKYPETITGQLKKQIDEINSILRNINALSDSLRQF